jgi:hypothetical protein
VLLNGIAGDPIKHGRGLRQGDPLLPLLFVIAIDPLNQILEGATTHGLLHKLRGRVSILRTSLYADNCYSCDGARKELWRLVDVGAVSPCAW